MRKKYKSETLAQLQELTAKLNNSGLLPHGFATKLAEDKSLNVVSVRKALGGLSANLDCFREIIIASESLAEVNAHEAPKRKVRHLSIADLYNDSVFPARFAELASQKTGETANSIAYFIKGQIEGRTAYATNDNTIEALYQVAEMNEEWELLCRAENLIQQLP